MPGGFGTDCRSCHTEVQWKPVGYDHLKLARFDLAGAHAHLDCHDCHTGDVAKQKLAHRLRRLPSIPGSPWRCAGEDLRSLSQQPNLAGRSAFRS